MNIISYIHPTHTYLPCTGAGRHINNTLLGLASQESINLKLLCSQQWLQADGQGESILFLKGRLDKGFRDHD
jgi:hypothetical protein